MTMCATVRSSRSLQIEMSRIIVQGVHQLDQVFISNDRIVNIQREPWVFHELVPV